LIPTGYYYIRPSTERRNVTMHTCARLSGPILATLGINSLPGDTAITLYAGEAEPNWLKYAHFLFARKSLPGFKSSSSESLQKRIQLPMVLHRTSIHGSHAAALLHRALLHMQSTMRHAL
jgi:hypothetical protein